MTRVTIPQLDANLVDVTITAWKKAPGDAVIQGETIAELTTDKAVYELEAPASGELLKILAPEKSVVPTGYITALIGSPGELDSEAEEQNELSMASYRGDTSADDSSGKRERKERIRATPKARRLARKNGLDLAEIQQKTGVDLIDEDAVNKFISLS
jgi:pyruvate dehydrogenase E2 component (dihydrolipoamide acetyltransferase)